MQSLKGQLLVAGPSLLDPNFRRTVVLVGEHTDEGALGVVLNRASEATVEDAVPELSTLIDDEELVVWRDAAGEHCCPRAHGVEDDGHDERGKHGADDGVEARVEDLDFRGVDARGGDRAGVERGAQLRGLREEAEVGQRREDLLIRRRQRDREQPRERRARDPQVLRPVHSRQDRRRHAQRDRGEQLVRDAEQRP